MKRVFLFIISIGFLSNIHAQCENAYFPFQPGISYEMTTYNAKDKMQGMVKSEVRDGDDNIIVKNTYYDKKGNEFSDGEFQVVCEDGTIKIDIQGLIPDEMLKSYENMEMVVEGDFLEFPGDIDLGTTLPDASGKVTIKMAESAGINMNTVIDMAFTDRRVELKETVTTSAGTFETYKITQKTTTKMTIMGMTRETTITSAAWVSKGVGTVKSENYDKSGNVESYSLLTKFEN